MFSHATYKILFRTAHNMGIIAIRESTPMRSVNIAELKNRLSRYLTFAKGGEEIIIRDRNLPVAKLVPFSGDEGSEDELLLVAAGKMRLPKTPVRVYRHFLMIDKSRYEQASRFLGRKRASALVCSRGKQSPGAHPVAEIYAGGVVGEPRRSPQRNRTTASLGESEGR